VVLKYCFPPGTGGSSMVHETPKPWSVQDKFYLYQA